LFRSAASALVSIGVTALIGFGFAFLGTHVVAQYGWGLFVGLPFCLGLFAVLTHSYHEPRGFGECMTVAILPMAILGSILFFVAIEGAICLAMAAPLASLLRSEEHTSELQSPDHLVSRLLL